MTSDYEDFRFERPGTLDLVFRGRVIATADSRDNTRKIPKDRPRWTEIVIYLTDSDKWIVLNAGCSDVPGETDKEAFYICSTPEEVQDAVMIKPAGVITTTAATALRRAAEADPRLKVVLQQRV